MPISSQSAARRALLATAPLIVISGFASLAEEAEQIGADGSPTRQWRADVLVSATSSFPQPSSRRIAR